MRKLALETLSRDSFNTYGFFENMLNPETEKIGSGSVEFYRDMLQYSCSNMPLSFSVCRIEPREFIIDTNECHSNTQEGILPIDNDIAIHVGPATCGEVPFNRLRAFLIPKGTMVVLRPGVWHDAPFALNDKPANVLIVLPERTYLHDCHKKESLDSEKIYIEIP